MIKLYIKYFYTFRNLITSKRIYSDSDTDNEKCPSKKSNLLQPPSPPPRISSTIYTPPVQYNPSHSTSIQSSNSPAALSVTHVSPAIFSIPTTSSTSQCTLAAHDMTLISVGEVVPDNGRG